MRCQWTRRWAACWGYSALCCTTTASSRRSWMFVCTVRCPRTEWTTMDCCLLPICHACYGTVPIDYLQAALCTTLHTPTLCSTNRSPACLARFSPAFWFDSPPNYAQCTPLPSTVTLLSSNTTLTYMHYNPPSILEIASFSNPVPARASQLHKICWIPTMHSRWPYKASNTPPIYALPEFWTAGLARISWSSTPPSPTSLPLFYFRTSRRWSTRTTFVFYCAQNPLYDSAWTRCRSSTAIRSQGELRVAYWCPIRWAFSLFCPMTATLNTWSPNFSLVDSSTMPYSLSQFSSPVTHFFASPTATIRYHSWLVALFCLGYQGTSATARCCVDSHLRLDCIICLLPLISIHAMAILWMTPEKD